MIIADAEDGGKQRFNGCDPEGSMIWSAAIHYRFRPLKAAKGRKAATTMSTWCPRRTPKN
jgi:hypothetical protein